MDILWLQKTPEAILHFNRLALFIYRNIFLDPIILDDWLILSSEKLKKNTWMYFVVGLCHACHIDTTNNNTLEKLILDIFKM